MSKLHKAVPLLIMVMMLISCGGGYVVKPGSVDPDFVPEDLRDKTLTLINTQESAEVIKIGDAGLGRSLEGNLQKWTDVLISTLETAFRKKGVTVADNSPKVLKIAIKRAVLESAGAGWAFRCWVYVDAETGNNDVVEFAVQKAYWKYPGSCDYAVKEAASVILNHNGIRNYLTQ